MKIALIRYRLILRGGLERRLINYSQWLQEQGHEVHIIVAESSGDNTSWKVQLHIPIARTDAQRYSGNAISIICWEDSCVTTISTKSLSLMRTSHQDAVLCPGAILGSESQRQGARTLSDREQIRADQLAFQRSKGGAGCF